MTKVNREIVAEILKNMPESKKEVLKNALTRNLILTSSYTLSSCTLVVYKEGFLVKLAGTRVNFSVYAKDDDGELIYTRKPNEDKLNKLYEEWQYMNESDYEGF